MDRGNINSFFLLMNEWAQHGSSIEAILKIDENS